MRFSLASHTLSNFKNRIEALVNDLTAHADKQTHAADALTEHLKSVAQEQTRPRG